MSKSGRDSSRIVTLDSVRSLASPVNPSKAVWKDLGVYLDKKLDWHLDTKTNSSTAVSSNTLLYNALSDSSYLSQVSKYQICKSCGRPIGEDSLTTHYERCLEMKQKKADAENGSSAAAATNKRKRGRTAITDASSVDSSRMASPAPATPSASSASQSKDQPRPKKKYKKSQMQKEKEAANAAAAAAAAAEAAAQRANNQQKKKKQQKTKAPTKAKGPVDVEKQCGVPLPMGGFCARSLTCKTHSMGAKRAVPGRSAPYDVLLQQYQKRNQARMAQNNALAAQRRENAQLSGMAGVEGAEGGSGSLPVVLDPDEETHLVLEGVSKSAPVPLERKVMIPARNRHRFLNMREAYANALITNGASAADTSASSGDLTLANQAISGSIGGLQGRCALVNVDASPNSEGATSTQSSAAIPGELYHVRTASKAIATTAQYNYQQQKQFQQRVFELQQQQLKQRQMQQQQAQQRQQSQSQPGAKQPQQQQRPVPAQSS
ncbi:hypothetical protein FT663_01715 [Candidozyma haemuli var. vulneris]|uniref:SCA7 domain-containing protein n=1 Tax=Candidozyma haemuli TaxID=45357 RepID=A0A2V1AYX3_9ASCO|nr:hypothetical protein CXQ85_003001 [[Candida] haemuloni]KAF3991260.1 hypothetical protein FT662_01811 [[Candida] haemuloni var. vulneris]KAF3993815.1 hypothetical protein FT663_01715 [[Candida] haemuloni var. vulneris]PVH23267.1 hypothetical protein CXQ85_003001 [[Candida] haemuloni]